MPDSDEIIQLRSALTQAHRAMTEAVQYLARNNTSRAFLWLDAGIAAADQALRTAGLPETTEARP